LSLGEGQELAYPGELIYPIVLEALEAGDRLLCCFEYSNQWAVILSRAPGHFRTVLEAIVANPDSRVADLPLLTAAERRQIVEEWNPPARSMAPGFVHELFERQAERQPDAVAVIAADERVTYRELNARANRLAHRLRAAGAGPEVRVGVLLDRSIEMVTALLAVLKAGAAYVPMDPAYPADRLAFMASDSGMPLLVTTRALVGARPGLASAGRAATVVCLDEQAAEIAREPETNPRVAIHGANLAYVIYTSGSTGTPKGVQVPHGALANYTQVAAETFELTPADRVLQFASISFDTMAEEIYPCLARGAALALRTHAMLASVPAFLRQIREWRISVLNFPTAYWHELTRQMLDGGFDLPDDVRLTILGGERAQPERVGAWQARFGRRVRLINSYGPTESTIVATYFEVPADDAGRWATADVPIGRPIPNASVYVLGPNLEPVPAGVPGELYVGGAGVARGYLNQPALTAERFVPDPFGGTPGARLYRTGDLVRYRANGEIEFLGRVDDQIKIRGFRVEVGEVEAALLRDDAVEHAAVLLREDQPGDRRLVAYAVLRQTSVTAHELRTRLRSVLPDYMVPDAFVLVDAMPLTPNGKVDHAALPAPDQERQAAEAYVAPRTQVEQRIAAIWADVLRVERVGLDDNFFDLGGHSLLVIQLHARLREAFGDELSVIDLFKVPTVRLLADRLNRAAEAPHPAAHRVQDRASQQRQAFQRLKPRPVPGAGVR
jgi:amino acid adenylation domain-containing protein